MARETRFLPRWNRSTTHSEIDDSEHRALMSEASNDSSSSDFEASSSISEGSQSDAGETGAAMDVSTLALASQLDHYPVGQEHFDQQQQSSLSPSSLQATPLESPVGSPGHAIEDLMTPMCPDHQITPSAPPEPLTTSSYFDHLQGPSKYDSDASDSTIPAPPASASASASAIVPPTLAISTCPSPPLLSPELPTPQPIQPGDAVSAPDRPAASHSQDPCVAEPSPPASRIPRRTRLSARLGSIARQFEQPQDGEDECEIESPLGSPVFQRIPLRRFDPFSESEQEVEAQPRPLFRRGRTDGSLGRSKPMTKSGESGALSDTDGKPLRRSRIPISTSRTQTIPAVDTVQKTLPSLPTSPTSDHFQHGKTRPRSRQPRAWARRGTVSSDGRPSSPPASAKRTPSVHSDTRRVAKPKPKSMGRVASQTGGTYGQRPKPLASASHVLTLSRQFVRIFTFFFF